MRRIAALLAAGVILAAGVSPALADHPEAYQCFWVSLFDDDGNIVDEGVLAFWVNDIGELKLTNQWCGDGGRVWVADVKFIEGEDYGRYGCEWDAWPEDEYHGQSGDDPPYDGFSAIYCKPWRKLYGHAEPRGLYGTSYSLYGIGLSGFVAGRR